MQHAAPKSEMSMRSGSLQGAHVPRGMVHKTADREVFVAAAEQVAEDRFEVTARWPDDHLLYRAEEGGVRDSLVVVETFRQIGIHLSHRYYRVPTDHAFVLHGFEFELAEPLADRGSPVVFDTSVRRAGTNPRRFRLSARTVIRVGGREVGCAEMSWDALSPTQYGVVRSRGPVLKGGEETGDVLEALPAASVGRREESASVLATGPTQQADSWLLRMDTSHPALFDHASDHVPGMVLAEAFRQAVHVSSRQNAEPKEPLEPLDLRAMNMSFDAFGELGHLVVITIAADADSGEFLATARQYDRVLATARLAVPRSTVPLQRNRRAGAAC